MLVLYFLYTEISGRKSDISVGYFNTCTSAFIHFEKGCTVTLLIEATVKTKMGDGRTSSLACCNRFC